MDDISATQPMPPTPPEFDEENNNLIKHARHELALIHEDDFVVEGIVNIVREFAKMGNSGGSAPFVIHYVTELLSFRPLSPVTNNPDEWHHHDATVWGEEGGIWQNKRDGRLFSRDGGKTYSNVEERELTTDGITQLYTSAEFEKKGKDDG